MWLGWFDSIGNQWTVYSYISWMIWNINNSRYERTKYRWQQKSLIDGNFWEIGSRILHSKKEFISAPVKWRLYFFCINTSTHQIIKLLCKTCYAQNVDRILWKNNTSSTRYSWDFPELSRHIHLTVPMNEGWCPLLPMLATCLFETFLISPTNMLRWLQMWKFTLLSHIIVEESVSQQSLSLDWQRSSTLSTEVNTENNDIGDFKIFGYPQ